MTLEQIVKIEMIKRLREQQYNRTKTAQSLGIGLRTLQRHLSKWQMKDVFSDRDLNEINLFPTQEETPKC